MKSVAVALRLNSQARGSGIRTHRRSRIPTLQRFEINGGLPLDSTVNGTHTLGGLLYLLGFPSSLSVGLLRVLILCPLAKMIPIRLPPLPPVLVKPVLEILALDSVDDLAGSSDAINLQKALVLYEEIIISAMRPASIFLSFDFTIL